MQTQEKVAIVYDVIYIELQEKNFQNIMPNYNMR